MPRAKTKPAEEAKAAKTKPATPKTAPRTTAKPVTSRTAAKSEPKPTARKTATKAASTSRPGAAKASRPSISGEERQRMIAVAAYFRAEKRGFHPGYEDEDWCAAEDEINKLLGS